MVTQTATQRTNQTVIINKSFGERLIKGGITVTLTGPKSGQCKIGPLPYKLVRSSVNTWENI